MTHKYKLALFLQCMSFAFISPAGAQVVLFDFNNLPIYSPLPISETVNGITARYTATGEGYSIQDANVLGFTPKGFSGNIIYPNSVYLADLLIKFDTPLSYFSIMYSCQELGCDDAATMRVTAYLKGSYTGTNTMTARKPGTWPVDTLKCNFPQGFDSVVLHYDSPPPTCQDYGVIFMADNMKVITDKTLPVSMLYFNGASDGNTAILNWKAAAEINLKNYMVQYSTDGIRFLDLASINAHGADYAYNYSQKDVTGTTYYRLKMIDKDGHIQYSEIKELTFNNESTVFIIPNPSSDYIQIYCSNNLEIKTIKIFTVDGIPVRMISNYYDGQKINIQDLPDGTYILKISTLNDSQTIKKLFIKIP